MCSLDVEPEQLCTSTQGKQLIFYVEAFYGAIGYMYV